MSTRVDINSNILTWAINRAGYELNEFVVRFPNVEKWITQEKKPTVKQLQEFSHKVHIPFGYLLLEEPPEETVPIPYFRTGSGLVNQVSLNVHETIQLLQRRQDWLVNYLEENDFDSLEFVGKYSVNTNYKEIVADIRNTLQLPVDWGSKHGTFEKALNHLTNQVEKARIIVSFNSVVGNSNKRSIPLDECRGFVLVNELAPFLFVNSADAKSAQVFTIIHEIAHIWIGQSAGFDFAKFLPADDPVEVLCNQVAAELLVPEIDFLEKWEENPNYKKLGKKYKVSPIVIARRALDLKKISKPNFFDFYNPYITEIKNIKKRQSGGGDFYATARKRLSLSFAGYINQAVKQNTLLYRDAYKLTGLKGNTFSEFMKQNFQTNG